MPNSVVFPTKRENRKTLTDKPDKIRILPKTQFVAAKHESSIIYLLKATKLCGNRK